jgi:hypothetical protein
MYVESETLNLSWEILSEFPTYNIQEFFDQYKDEITIKMQNIIETFIQKMDNENYETDKKNDIKIIIYNNSDSMRNVHVHANTKKTDVIV